MKSENDGLKTSQNAIKNLKSSTTPVMSKLSVEHSPNTLSMEEWVQNGINRLNDQTTPFPKVF
ncbi:hypothetical protein [Granulicella mallensis]|uniref:Uncharacterized protein n=1 Tax=Granulicella mallensis TaxID=940614 RepID=A0A7W7ZQE8_9BACT|nr:hypothetical protein [Granulicella mallensis]MBB5063928.1 hypothetical protein [Granulicella mallensis]